MSLEGKLGKQVKNEHHNSRTVRLQAGVEHGMHMGHCESGGLWGQMAWIQILDAPLTRCTNGKLINLSLLQCYQL